MEKEMEKKEEIDRIEEKKKENRLERGHVKFDQRELKDKLYVSFHLLTSLLD